MLRTKKTARRRSLFGLDIEAKRESLVLRFIIATTVCSSCGSRKWTLTGMVFAGPSGGLFCVRGIKARRALLVLVEADDRFLPTFCEKISRRSFSYDCRAAGKRSPSN
jgi:hypothetical protein